RRLNLARMTPTTLTKLEQGDVQGRLDVPEALKKAITIATRPLQLRAQARAATSEEARNRLLDDAKVAEKTAEAELPGLYQEVIDKHANTPAVFDAGFNLLRNSAKSKAGAEKVAGWAKALMSATPTYGERWQKDVALRIAEMVAQQDGLGALAL